MKTGRHLIRTLGFGLAITTLSVALTGCASTPTRESTGEFIDDATITTKVKAKLVGEPGISALDVNVETFKGIVQLSGFVDTKEQAERAAALAKQVAGVRSVKNSLVLKNPK